MAINKEQILTEIIKGIFCGTILRDRSAQAKTGNYTLQSWFFFL